MKGRLHRIISQEPSLIEIETAGIYGKCSKTTCNEKGWCNIDGIVYCHHHWITRIQESIFVDTKMIAWRSTPDQQRYEVFWKEEYDPEDYPLMTVTHAADAHWLLMIYKERFARGEYSILF